MDNNGKASKSKSSKKENKMASEVVIEISDGHSIPRERVDSPQKLSCPLPEIASLGLSPNRPPKIRINRRASMMRLVSSEPKSRFGEQPIDHSSKFEENGTLKSPDKVEDKKLRTRGDVRGEDEIESICEKVNSNEWVIFECVSLLCIVGFMVASLIVDKLRLVTVWSFEIWKWCVLVTVVLFGWLVTNWFMEVVLMIRKKLFLKTKAFYFVPSLRSSFQVFVWFSLVLTTWILLFHGGVVNTSPTASRVLNYITRTLISLPIGALLWLSKTTMLKIFASSLHASTRFDRIQESIFNQYILQKLSGPPIMEPKKIPRIRNDPRSQLRFQRTTKKRGKEKKEKLEVMDINKLYKTKREGVSVAIMIMFVEIIQSSSLTITIPKVPKQSADDEKGEQTDMEITSERKAFEAAYHIFQNVSQHGCNFIHEMNMRRFLTVEEMDKVFPLSDDTEMEPMNGKALMDWVVKVFNDRQALVHALDDTKTALRKLDKLFSGILLIGMIILWLLLVEIATIKALFFLSSQLLVAAFIFGNSCKTTFESIIFIFIMHPFDVGDRCVIDGVQMIVEEINLLTTVFLRYDNEKIYYPNSVLATKPISNFYRSPDMGDSLEFSIDFRTPLQKIGELKEKIKLYLEDNSLLWHPNHSVVVKEIENVNKIKMALYFTHTMNFQNFGEKNNRKSELVLVMKKIFEKVGIKYNLLLQELRVVD